VPSLRERFAQLKSRGEAALVPFVTAGDPDLVQLPAILRALEDGGADLIEVGLPFSDPIADGPTIQASSQRALDRGTKVREILKAVASRDGSVPIVYMGYTNTAMRRGFQAFATDAKDSGADAVLLSDLTPDEAGPWLAACKHAGLDSVFLVAPTSTDERIRMACEAATGFVYCVSRTGVTGAESSIPPDVASTVSRIRQYTELPVCVGFGISREEHVRLVAGVADGAVVGSHIVSFLHENWRDGAGVADFIQMIKSLKLGTLRKVE
jgi:tryptophan synthase alpha chain